ncbi:hypothetical protein [Hymenobacter siberiensis]|uniref:hypothetical protein n=1 Tax=Hymenobacter siberiensis TaxID=2848396 RepID=UPI001C1DD604|nr:hypothetical protein [Hymenobacter siberiensis]
MNDRTPKTYDLATIADVVKVVTIDNVEALSKDFDGFLRSIVAAKGFLQLTGGQRNELELTSLKWTDDGIFKVTTDIHAPGEEDAIIRTVLQKDEASRD